MAGFASEGEVGIITIIVNIIIIMVVIFMP